MLCWCNKSVLCWCFWNSPTTWLTFIGSLEEVRWDQCFLCFSDCYSCHSAATELTTWHLRLLLSTRSALCWCLHVWRWQVFPSVCCRKIRYCSLFSQQCLKNSVGLCASLPAVPSQYNDKRIIVTLMHRWSVCVCVCMCSCLVLGVHSQHNHTRKWVYTHHDSQGISVYVCFGTRKHFWWVC